MSRSLIGTTPSNAFPNGMHSSHQAIRRILYSLLAGLAIQAAADGQTAALATRPKADAPITTPATPAAVPAVEAEWRVLPAGDLGKDQPPFLLADLAPVRGTGRVRPLLIYIPHRVGANSHPDDLLKLNLALELRGAKTPLFEGMVAIPQFEAAGSSAQKQATLLGQAIDALIPLHSIDLERIYLAGEGDGTGVVWALAGQQPWRFAGIVSMGGGFDPAEGVRYRRIPTRWRDAPNDPGKNCQLVQDCLDTLIKLGGDAQRLSPSAEASAPSREWLTWVQTCRRPILFNGAGREDITTPDPNPEVGSVRGNGTPEKPFLIPPAPNLIRLDGQVRDWYDVPALHLPPHHNARGSVRFCWTEKQGLFILLTAVDTNPWIDELTPCRSDGLELLVQTETRTGGAVDRFFIGPSWSPNERRALTARLDTEGMAHPAGFPAVWRRTGYGYALECCIPWQELGSPAGAVGGRLKINFILHDDGMACEQLYYKKDASGTYLHPDHLGFAEWHDGSDAEETLPVD